MHSRKWALALGLAGLCGLVLTTACGGDSGAKLAKDIQVTDASITGKPEDVIAKVNGQAITVAEMNLVASRGAPQPGGPQKDAQLQALNSLIDQLVLANAAAQKGLTVPDSLVDPMITRWEGQFTNPQDRDKRLADMGMTLPQLREKIRLDQLVQQFVRETVQDTLKVSDAELQSYYDANAAQFEQGESVHARHILVSCDPAATPEVKEAAKRKAEALGRRVRGGEDFAAVASAESDCPSKAQGGDLGFFTRDRMVKPFADAAFALSPGQVSDVVETQFGYHVIKLEERKPGGKMPLDQIAEQLRGFLMRQKLQGAVDQLAKSLRAKAKIKTAIQI
jgi:peptidyl-prolyl cis-trans isomerase C